MKNYCGRDALSKVVADMVTANGNHTEREAHMFIKFMHLYTDEIPGFTKKYMEDEFDKVAWEAWIYRYLFLMKNGRVAHKMGLPLDSCKSFIELATRQFVAALSACVDAGEYEDDFEL